jgi:hypothetical protein
MDVVLFIMRNFAILNRHDYVVKLFARMVHEDVNPAFLNKVMIALLHMVTFSYLQKHFVFTLKRIVRKIFTLKPINCSGIRSRFIPILFHVILGKREKNHFNNFAMITPTLSYLCKFTTCNHEHKNNA